MLPGGSVRTALESDSGDDLMQAVLEMLGQSDERRRVLDLLGTPTRTHRLAMRNRRTGFTSLFT